MGERLGEGVALATTQKTPPHPNLLPQIQGCVLRQLSSLALPLNLGEKEQEVRNFKVRSTGPAHVLVSLVSPERDGPIFVASCHKNRDSPDRNEGPSTLLGPVLLRREQVS